MIDSYLDPDDDYRDYDCACCESKEEQLGQAREYLDKIVKQLYSIESLRYVKELDLLCDTLGVRIPEVSFKSNSQEILPDPCYLNEFIVLTNIYRKTLSV